MRREKSPPRRPGRNRRLPQGAVPVDVSEAGAEVGLTVPVACTWALWDRYVVPPEPLRPLGQNQEDRLRDLLWTLRNALIHAQSRGHAGSRLSFEAVFRMKPDQDERVALVAARGTAPNGQPGLTVMLPEQR
jgi:hypothetical protein